MKDRPILMSAPMVRATLRDLDPKQQTRRVAKDVKHPDFGNVYTPGALASEPQSVIERACPYGRPGDRLWVRETHSPQSDCWGSWDRWMRGEGGPGPVIHYKATDPKAWVDCWRPSIHMPRWASRIALEITGVRLERLNAITEADCIAEGIEKTAHNFWRLYGPHYGANATYSPRTSFRTLWESINGAESWAAGPWVWVVEFKRLPITPHRRPSNEPPDLPH